MQALKVGVLMSALCAGAPAWADDWVKLDLGEHAVPGACPAVALRALKASPQQQQQPPQQQQQANRSLQVSTWEAGKVSIGMRAWPSTRLNDQQRIRFFNECSRQAAQRVSSAVLVGPERAAEEALQGAINQCLGERQQSFTARTVVLSRSSPRC